MYRIKFDRLEFSIQVLSYNSLVVARQNVPEYESSRLWPLRLIQTDFLIVTAILLITRNRLYRTQ